MSNWVLQSLKKGRLGLSECFFIFVSLVFPRSSIRAERGFLLGIPRTPWRTPSLTYRKHISVPKISREDWLWSPGGSLLCLRHPWNRLVLACSFEVGLVPRAGCMGPLLGWQLTSGHERRLAPSSEAQRVFPQIHCLVEHPLPSVPRWIHTDSH